MTSVVAHSWQPVDLLAVADAPPEPPTISGLVYPGRRHLVSGEPESLKSWLGLVICVEEIRKGETVFWIDFEMGPRDVLARLRDLGLTNEEIHSQVVYLEPDEPLRSEAMADIVNLINERRPTVIVIDALAGALQLHGLDGNLGKDVEKLYRLLEPFREHGAAWILFDHLVKDRESRGKWAIGSERKVGGVDVHLGVTARQPFGRGKHGVATIKTHKDRPGYLPRPRTGELSLASNTDTGNITWEISVASHEQTETATVAGFRPTVLMERVSTYVENCAEPVSRRTVEAAVNGKANGIRTAIDVLLAESYLVDNGTGTRSAITSQRSFREAEDMSASPASLPRPSASRDAENASASPRPPLYKGDTGRASTPQEAMAV